jgi:hypothetical protein
MVQGKNFNGLQSHSGGIMFSVIKKLQQLTIHELDELQDQQPELVYELIQDAGY